ncbi:MAG: hypothetical protein QW582_01120 [Candidatus Micrarchaeaceae archaeon]
MSDGKTIQKPKFFKKKEKRIAYWQRIVAKRKKGKERLALNDRTYHCNVCNLIMDRDLINSDTQTWHTRER